MQLFREKFEINLFAERCMPLKPLVFAQSAFQTIRMSVAEDADHPAKALALLFAVFNFKAAFNHCNSVSYPAPLNRHGYMRQGAPGMVTRSPMLNVFEPIKYSPEREANLQRLRAEEEPRRWALGSDLGGKLCVVGEAGPLVAVYKPRDLAIRAGHPSTKNGCVIDRLAQERGGKWYNMRRFFLSSKEWGVVCFAKDSDRELAEETTRTATLELWYEVVVFMGSEGSFPDKTSVKLPLPTIGSVATLSKLKEEGRVALLSARLTLSEGSSTSTRDAADALTAALFDLGLPVAGTMEGCHKLKPRGRQRMRVRKVPQRLVSLVRLRCGALDTKVMFTPQHFENALEDERRYAKKEAQRKEEHFPTMVSLLTSPAAANHSEYAPVLEQLELRRLGVTPEEARTTLDALQLPAPSDDAWLRHANAVLDMKMLEQWHANPLDRVLLQHGRQTSYLLSCIVRVSREGHPPMEWFTQGEKVGRDDALLVGRDSTNMEERKASSSDEGHLPLDEMRGPLRALSLKEKKFDDRGNHAELIALNKAFRLCLETSPSGEGCMVEVLVSHYPCVSCAAAMRCFAARLPDAQLRVGFRDWESMQRTLNAALSRQPAREN